MDYNYSTNVRSDDGFVILFYLCCCILILPFLAFWIWMLIDAAKRKFPEGKDNEKVIWLLILLLTSPLNTFVGIGSILYYFLVKRKYDNASATQTVPTVAEVIETKPVESEGISEDIKAEAKVEDKVEKDIEDKK